MPAGRPKGQPKTGGRKLGSRNKLTVALKSMIEGALNNVGGQKYLEQQARECPEAFLTLLGKTLPKDLTIGGGLKLQVNLVNAERRTTD